MRAWFIRNSPAKVQGQGDILALLETMQGEWVHPEGKHALAVAVRRIKGMPDHEAEVGIAPLSGADR